MLIALASVKHAPGVTTAALGLAAAWPGRVLLVECDPAGADIAAWLQLPAGPGLVDVALELRRANEQQASDPSALSRSATALDGDRLWLLRGVDDPRQAAAITGSWPALADQLRRLRHENDGPVDVIADCGRLSDAQVPWPVLETADVVVLILAPTVAGVRLVGRWLPSLQQRLGEGRYGQRLRLLVVGAGPYPAADVADALGLPLLGMLPEDRPAAASLAAGGGRRVGRSRLWRALSQVAHDLSAQQAALAAKDADDADPSGVISMVAAETAVAEPVVA